MSEIKPIKIGLAGIGRAGYGMHRGEVAKTEGRFEFVALCDTDATRPAEFIAKEGKECKVYTDYAEMLKDPEVEMVSVAVRSPEHTPFAIMALEAGKYVFLEKPIAISMKQALELKAAAEKYPGKLFLRHNRRFEPCFNHIKEIMASGILGEVYQIRLRRHGYQRRNDWQTIIECGGGMLNNWGPHIVDHALRLLESPVKDVWSKLRRVAAVGDAEDHLTVIFEGENGRIIDIEISGGTALKEPVYMVYGDRGALMSVDESELKLKYINPKQKLMDIKAEKESPPLTASFGNPETLEWIEETIKTAPSNQEETWKIWLHVYDAIRNGVTYPITIEEGVDVVKYTDLVKNNSEFKLK